MAYPSFNRDPAGSASEGALSRVLPLRHVLLLRYVFTARSPLGRG